MAVQGQILQQGGALPRSGALDKPSVRERIESWGGNLGFWLCAAFLALIVVFALTADLLAPMVPTAQVPVERLLPPLTETSRGMHWFGTDQLGRDLLSNVIAGARLTLFIAVTATFIGMVIGTGLGMAAGYFGGNWDRFVMRLTEAQTAMPMFLVAIFFLTVVGPSVINLIIVLPALAWPAFARVIRAETLRVRENLFIEAAIASGASSLSVLWFHILPNVAPRVLVIAVIEIGGLMLAEAGLSFLGIGVQPPDNTWGLLIARGRQYLAVAWWLAILPGIVLGITVLAFNILSRKFAGSRGPAG
jgi:peptide/nickel transport system permease protein